MLLTKKLIGVFGIDETNEFAPLPFMDEVNYIVLKGKSKGSNGLRFQEKWFFFQNSRILLEVGLQPWLYITVVTKLHWEVQLKKIVQNVKVLMDVLHWELDNLFHSFQLLNDLSMENFLRIWNFTSKRIVTFFLKFITTCTEDNKKNEIETFNETSLIIHL